MLVFFSTFSIWGSRRHKVQGLEIWWRGSRVMSRRGSEWQNPHMQRALTWSMHPQAIPMKRALEEEKGQRTWRLLYLGYLAQWLFALGSFRWWEVCANMVLEWTLDDLKRARWRQLMVGVNEGHYIIDQSHKLKYKSNTGLRIVVEGQSMLLLVINGLFWKRVRVKGLLVCSGCIS